MRSAFHWRIRPITCRRFASVGSSSPSWLSRTWYSTRPRRRRPPAPRRGGAASAPPPSWWPESPLVSETNLTRWPEPPRAPRRLRRRCRSRPGGRRRRGRSAESRRRRPGLQPTRGRRVRSTAAGSERSTRRGGPSSLHRPPGLDPGRDGSYPAARGFSRGRPAPRSGSRRNRFVRVVTLLQAAPGASWFVAVSVRHPARSSSSLMKLTYTPPVAIRRQRRRRQPRRPGGARARPHAADSQRPCTFMHEVRVAARRTPWRRDGNAAHGRRLDLAHEDLRQCGDRQLLSVPEPRNASRWPPSSRVEGCATSSSCAAQA